MLPACGGGDDASGSGASAGADPYARVKENTLTRTIFTMQWFYESGATAFVRAAQSSDTALMPWGSAVGSASDGDMNRLVRDYHWSAEELATFYHRATWLTLLALVGAHVAACLRLRRARAAS